MVLNKLLRHEGLTPNNKVLCELLSLWLDADGEDRLMLANILKGKYGTPDRVKWSEVYDGEVRDGTNFSKEVVSTIKQEYAGIMEEEK